jgi:hypothetical protein
MSDVDSAAMGRARALLKPLPRQENPAGALAAAAFFAFTALALAGVVITQPPAMSARHVVSAPHS